MFATFFITVILSVFVLRLFLAIRQMRYIASHANSVPLAFQEKISLHSHTRAANYNQEKLKLSIFSLLIDTAFLLSLTYGGLLQNLHILIASYLPEAGILYGLCLFFSITIIGVVLELPFDLYAQFVIEEKYGFNKMSLSLFWRDFIKQGLLGLLISAPLLAALFWLVTAASENWWWLAWCFLCGFMLLMQWIFPNYIAPLFNKFTPLDNEALKNRIESLLQRSGFQSGGLFVMDGSKRSGHGNAYFSGFGKTRRIVFFDTLLERLNEDEIEAVLAHELGHFKKKHIIKRFSFIFLSLFGLLYLLSYLKESLWFYESLGVFAQNTPLALILFMQMVPIFLFPFSAFLSAKSRADEFEADAYAGEIAQKDALASALVRLYEDNAATLTPDPLYSLFYDSHPPAALRIARLQATS